VSTYVRWFDEISHQDVAGVGGKTASLGEMYRTLGPLGVRVPNGFAITAAGYWALLDQSGLRQRIAELLSGLDKHDVDDLARRGHAIRLLISQAALPASLWSEIQAAYAELGVEKEPDGAVAVRSSATAEDLPTASFAGQQESFLNVRGPQSLRQAIGDCFASLFTDRAISYRIDQGFGHLDVALSIAVQKMVRSDLACSGVMFTLDTETGFRDVVLIEGAFGLGENIVQGTVDPDEFCVYKPMLRAGKRPILRRRVGTKQFRMVYGMDSAGHHTHNEPLPDADRQRLCLCDDEVLQLARWALRIEEHYSQLNGRDCPMDIEWAKDGPSGELYIVQARPETVESRRRTLINESYVLTQKGPVLATGRSVGRKVAAGTARVVSNVNELYLVRPGDVLVAETTTPDWEPVMKLASAIVTNHGGRTCHAAIIARELGIPAVVGTGEGTKKIPDGAAVTVSCTGGDTGLVFSGNLPFHVEKHDLLEVPATRTQIQMNIGDPAQAFALSALPNDGVGLARMEFIISSAIRIHPMALLHPERVEPETWQMIAGLTAAYAEKPAFFVDRLAEGIGTIAAAFHPKPVIVRLSDFKSNEYASLLGGRAFEADEENPMLGLRGAARYQSVSKMAAGPILSVVRAHVQ
jgi:pyruvate,water dikinase